MDLVFTHHLKTFPEFITQKEKQLVQYRGSAYILSPYKIVAQTTKVSLSSSNVESFTKVKPSSQSDSMITYGPYNNVAPLSTVTLFSVSTSVQFLLLKLCFGRKMLLSTLKITHHFWVLLHWSEQLKFPIGEILLLKKLLTCTIQVLNWKAHFPGLSISGNKVVYQALKALRWVLLSWYIF